MQVNPYLNFNGQCETAFKFYEQSLGGKIVAMMAHAGTPVEAQTPAGWHDKILHACISVGETMIMGSDAPPEHYEKPQGFSVSLTVADAAEAERIYGLLAEGGKVCMPMEETFWAVRFGMCTDRFGTPWIVSCNKTD